MSFVYRTTEGNLQINRLDLDLFIHGILESAENKNELDFIIKSINNAVGELNEEFIEYFEHGGDE